MLHTDFSLTVRFSLFIKIVLAIGRLSFRASLPGTLALARNASVPGNFFFLAAFVSSQGMHNILVLQQVYDYITS